MTKEYDSTAEKDRDDLIFKLIQKRFDNEWQRLKDLDNKASNMIGFVSIAVGILLGAGTISFTNILQISPIASIFFFLGTGLLIGSIIFSLMGFKIRGWDDVPNVGYLIEKYTSKSYREVLRRVAGEMKKVIVEMEIKLNDKAKSIDIAWHFLISGFLFVFIFVIILVISNSHIPEELVLENTLEINNSTNDT